MTTEGSRMESHTKVLESRETAKLLHDSRQSGRKSGASGLLRKSGMSVGELKTKSFYETAAVDSEGTLTTSGAVLGIISTILGGGMIAIPFAIYNAGFALGFVISAFAMT